MDYKITCRNCGQVYRLTAEGGQTVWAKCPNCGQKMRVSLPIVNGNSPQTGKASVNPSQAVNNGYTSGTPTNDGGNPDNNKKGKSHTTNILLALILGILVGGIGWYAWQQKQKNDEQERIELKQARQAHMDSLMALRNQQNAEEAAAQKAEQDRQEVTDFLNNFYDVWFADGDMSQFDNNLSEQCYERLSTSLDEPEDSTSTDNEIDWDLLCPQMGKASQNGHHSASPVSISINHYEDNWYRIRFSSDGRSEFRQIEAFPQNGKVIINDYR